MSKREAGFILVIVGFIILALLFLVLYLVRRKNVGTGGKALAIICAVCIIVALCFGIVYHNETNICKRCGGKATVNTGLGNYCRDCLEETVSKQCSRCGKTVNSYVSKGGQTYCHACALSEGYMQ